MNESERARAREQESDSETETDTNRETERQRERKSKVAHTHARTHAPALPVRRQLHFEAHWRLVDVAVPQAQQRPVVVTHSLEVADRAFKQSFIH